MKFKIIIIYYLLLFIKPLTHLVNFSIKNGIFPDELKIAKVVPIFKANDKQNIENSVENSAYLSPFRFL